MAWEKLWEQAKLSHSLNIKSGVWKGKKPHSQGLAQGKNIHTPSSKCLPPPASHHRPTATATATSPDSMWGECAISLCWMESRAIYSTSEQGGKLLSTMFISNFSRSDSAFAYLRLYGMKQCISVCHGVVCVGCWWGLQMFPHPLWKVLSENWGFTHRVCRGLWHFSPLKSALQWSSFN